MSTLMTLSEWSSIQTLTRLTLPVVHFGKSFWYQTDTGVARVFWAVYLGPFAVLRSCHSMFIIRAADTGCYIEYLHSPKITSQE